MSWDVTFKTEEYISVCPSFLKDGWHYNHICSSRNYQAQPNCHYRKVKLSVFTYGNPLLVYWISMHQSLGGMEWFNIIYLVLNWRRLVLLLTITHITPIKVWNVCELLARMCEIMLGLINVTSHKINTNLKVSHCLIILRLIRSVFSTAQTVLINPGIFHHNDTTCPSWRRRFLSAACSVKQLKNKSPTGKL